MKKRMIAAGVTVAGAALVLTACAGTGGSSSSSSGEATTVRFALDWTPNTNHTGLFVAQEKGYFADAGLNVEILPYNGSYPDTLIDSGAAECGIGFQESSSVSMAAGANVTSVLALLQHWATAIGVNASNDAIQSPKDLDGKIYAGFGSPTEGPMLSTVIEEDGGTGQFETVTLSTSAYEAVYSGAADFTIPFATWEGIEAELRGEPFKMFQFTDYGMPDNYAVMVDCNTDWLAQNPETATAFVQALQKGYEDTQADPAAAGDILIAANPDVFSTDEAKELVHLSQEMISSDYMLASDGSFGTMTQERWDALGQWLFDNGLLVDANGSPLTSVPDWSAFFTNEYIATS
jgi:ABC-type nitrate/sulfonate/bicarbonate transport system substrate-binding protein